MKINKNDLYTWGLPIVIIIMILMAILFNSCLPSTSDVDPICPTYDQEPTHREFWPSTLQFRGSVYTDFEFTFEPTQDSLTWILDVDILGIPDIEFRYNTKDRNATKNFEGVAYGGIIWNTGIITHTISYPGDYPLIWVEEGEICPVEGTWAIMVIEWIEGPFRNSCDIRRFKK